MLPARRILRPTLSRFFNEDWNDGFNWHSKNLVQKMATTPKVNIQELDDSFIVEVAAPGFKKEDFHVEVENDILTIKSEVSAEDSETKDDNYSRKEFTYSSFSRSFNLNKEMVDDTKIKATYKDGILSISLPKREEAKEKPARLIQIS